MSKSAVTSSRPPIRRTWQNRLATVLLLTVGLALGATASISRASAITAHAGATWHVLPLGAAGRGARVTQALEVSGTPAHLYVDAHGIITSKNGGKSWRRLTTASTTLLALSPSFRHDHLILALRGRHLAISHDNFRHVQIISIRGLPHVTLAAVSPTFSQDHTLFASCRHCRRIAVSTTGGRGWHVVALPTPALGVLSLLVSSHFRADHLIYADVLLPNKGTGLARSNDGGRTWRMTAGSSTITNAGGPLVNQFALAGDGTLLAADAIAAVQRSTDGGQSWQEADTGLVHWHYVQRAFHAVYVAATGTTALALDAGTHVSTDGGQHWLRLATVPGGGLAAPALLRPGVFALGPRFYAIDGHGRLEVLLTKAASGGTAPSHKSLPTISGAVFVPVSTHTYFDGTWIYRFAGEGFWPGEQVTMVTTVGGWQQAFSGSADASGRVTVDMLYVPPTNSALVSQVSGSASGTINVALPHGNAAQRSSDTATTLAQAYLLTHQAVSAFAREQVQSTRLLPPSLYDPPLARPLSESAVGLAAVARAHHLKSNALVWVVSFGTVTSPSGCQDTSLDASTQVLEVYLVASTAVPDSQAVLGTQAYGGCTG